MTEQTEHKFPKIGDVIMITEFGNGESFKLRRALRVPYKVMGIVGKYVDVQAHGRLHDVGDIDFFEPSEGDRWIPWLPLIEEDPF